MPDPAFTIVDAYRYTRNDLNLNGNDLWGLALEQRAFGPHQLLVVTARRDGVVVGLAHCEQTEPPELAVTCCLGTLDDGAAVAVAYSHEQVCTDPPVGLRGRLDAARVAAREFGVHLMDRILCDDLEMRSICINLDDRYSWDAPDGGVPWPAPARQPDARTAQPAEPDALHENRAIGDDCVQSGPRAWSPA